MGNYQLPMNGFSDSDFRAAPGIVDSLTIENRQMPIAH
jgi:hypothetical protein